MIPGAPGQQRGIAILTVMLVVAIATVLAVELLWGTTLDLRRTQNLLERDQAQQIALGMEAGAGELLRVDYEDDPGIDSLRERWADPNGLAFSFEMGDAVGRLEDMQGRFNLNALVTPSGDRNDVMAQRFQRLVEQAAAELTDTRVDVPGLVDAVVDWLDPNQMPDGLGGAEDGVYTNRTPPHRAANFWFTSPTELLAVEHMTPELFDLLAPQITALPPEKQADLNVNTATPELLQALGDNVSVSDVEAWVDSRDGTPFESAEEFFQANGAFSGDEKPAIGVKSSWFGLTVIVSIGSTRLAMYSLLERANDGTVTPRLRSFDTR